MLKVLKEQPQDLIKEQMSRVFNKNAKFYKTDLQHDLNFVDRNYYTTETYYYFLRDCGSYLVSVGKCSLGENEKLGLIDEELAKYLVGNCKKIYALSKGKIKRVQGEDVVADLMTARRRRKQVYASL